MWRECPFMAALEGILPERMFARNGMIAAAINAHLQGMT